MPLASWYPPASRDCRSRLPSLSTAASFAPSSDSICSCVFPAAPFAVMASARYTLAGDTKPFCPVCCVCWISRRANAPYPLAKPLVIRFTGWGALYRVVRSAVERAVVVPVFFPVTVRVASEVAAPSSEDAASARDTGAEASASPFPPGTGAPQAARPRHSAAAQPRLSHFLFMIPLLTCP